MFIESNMFKQLKIQTVNRKKITNRMKFNIQTDAPAQQTLQQNKLKSTTITQRRSKEQLTVWEACDVS